MKNEKDQHLKYFGIFEILKYAKPHKKLIISMMFLMALGSGISILIPLFQNYAINHFIKLNTLDTIVPFIVLYVLLLIIQTISTSLGLYFSCKAEVNVNKDIKQKCFDHVQTLSFSFFNQNSVGYIHSRIMSDPERVGSFISWCLLDVVDEVVYLIGIFIVMFILNAYLALLLLIILPIEVLVIWHFQKKLTDQHRKVRESNSLITSNYNEGITGSKTIKSLVIEKLIQKEFEKDTNTMRIESIRESHYRALFHGFVIFFSSIALAFVLWQGGHLTNEGLMLVGSLSVFMNYATNMSEYVTDLVDTLARMINTQVNIERINYILNIESDVKDTKEVIEKYGDTFHPKKENWEPLYGDIQFKDVTFKYPDGDENVLEHFNLDIKQGSMVAIVGETGAGKSTLVNLVCRFYEPTQGNVFIDHKDARERSQLWLHSHIGYVLQTPQLFSGSVIDNLRYGNENATLDEMKDAIHKVCADKVIERLENGYETNIGEGGNKLSTGEKQLLSFARAILANPQILILDEATSSVDTITEKIIQDAIQTITKNRTSFVIAHRLSTIQNADIILVMQDGKIVEQGTHKELLNKQGYYYNLYTKQYIDEETKKAYESKLS